ncbi:unnamed protein product [Caenorhabditis sp. 36 PRJEB53466]|nr:unnamed protein product [Caenorhabditis sp. 36 PRJEB53466]
MEHPPPPRPLKLTEKLPSQLNELRGHSLPVYGAAFAATTTNAHRGAVFPAKEVENPLASNDNFACRKQQFS